jgi:hypothetical protein
MKDDPGIHINSTSNNRRFDGGRLIGVTSNQRSGNNAGRLRRETRMTEPLKVFWQPG